MSSLAPQPPGWLHVTSQGCYSTASGRGPSLTVSPSVLEKSQGQAVWRVISSIQLNVHFAQRSLSLEDPAPLQCPGLLGREGEFSQQFFLALLLGSVNLVRNTGFFFLSVWQSNPEQPGSGKPASGFSRASGWELPTGTGEGMRQIYIEVSIS